MKQPSLIAERSLQIALAAGMGYLAYRLWMYERGVRKSLKKSKKIRRRKTSRMPSKKVSPLRLRMAQASTIPMRMVKTRHGGLKLKAEDWVGERMKLAEIEKEIKQDRKKGR